MSEQIILYIRKLRLKRSGDLAKVILCTGVKHLFLNTLVPRHRFSHACDQGSSSLTTSVPLRLPSPIRPGNQLP